MSTPEHLDSAAPDGAAPERATLDTVVLDTVVLDLGEVLVHWEPHRAHPHLDEAQWRTIAERIDFPAWNLRADAGERWADLDTELALSWPEHAGFLTGYADGFASTLVGEVAGMADVVATLQRGGVRVLGLTNWSAETFPHGVARVPAIAALEAVVVSGALGVVKPSPAIYRHLLHEHGVTARRAMFVDDRLENVVAARELGFVGHHFTSAALLVADLAGRGLWPRA